MSDMQAHNGAVSSPSQIYRKAAGLTSQGAPLGNKSSLVCTMCAGQIEPNGMGEFATADTFGAAFNNKLDCHHRHDNVVCGDCLALWNKVFLQEQSKSYATRDGVFKFSGNADVSAFILFPPQSEYVAIFSTRQQQHMIWRSPVCLDPDYMQVRADDEIMTIRRLLVLDAVRAMKVVSERSAAIGIKGVAARMELKLAAPAMGAIRENIALAVSKDSEAGANAVATLRKLRMGEWWALGALRGVDLDKPETFPRPVKVMPASG